MLFMTPNVIKNLMNKSATRMYPVDIRDPFEDARGELYNEIENCIFCKSCERKCPSQCISVDMKKGTWECDPQACVYCGICVESCPTNCLHQKKEWRKPSREKVFLNMQGTPKAKKKKAAAQKSEK